MSSREPFDEQLRAELRALVSAAPPGLPPSLPTRRRRWIPIGAALAAGVLLGLVSTRLLPSRPGIGPKPTAIGSFPSSPVPTSKIADGLDGWSLHDIDAALPAGVGAQIFDVARAGSGLVAVGFTAATGERRQPAAWTSSDGVSWTRAKVGAGSTADGEPATELRAILPLDGELLGFAGTPSRSTVIYRSADDGHTWSPDPLASFAGPGVVADVTNGGPGYVAVGGMPNIDASLDFAGVWTSTDGLSWTPVTLIGDAPGLGPGYLRAVARDGSVLVTVGARGDAVQPGVWRSTDGLSWTDVSISVGPNLQAPVLTSVVATDHGFVAGGGGPGGRPGRGFWESRIWHSDDGSEWQLADLKVDAEGGIAQIVQLSDGRLVATGDLGGHAAAWVSIDGQTWVEDGPPATDKRTTVGAATPFGDGIVVAGSVVVSGPDGSQTLSRPLAWRSSAQPGVPPVASCDARAWPATLVSCTDAQRSVSLGGPVGPGSGGKPLIWLTTLAAVDAYFAPGRQVADHPNDPMTPVWVFIYGERPGDRLLHVADATNPRTRDGAFIYLYTWSELGSPAVPATMPSPGLTAGCPQSSVVDPAIGTTGPRAFIRVPEPLQIKDGYAELWVQVVPDVEAQQLLVTGYALDGQTSGSTNGQLERITSDLPPPGWTQGGQFKGSVKFWQSGCWHIRIFLDSRFIGSADVLTSSP